MNLFDVKNALETIVRLNPGIKEDRLIVLLQAANWDHAHIDEAVILFRGMTPEIPAPQVDEKHLLPKHEEVPQSVSFDAVIPSLDKPQVPVVSPYQVHQTAQKIEQPPQQAEPIATVVPQEEHLPAGLPVKPFDASPNVLTFSKYKDMYHGGEIIPVLQKGGRTIISSSTGEELIHIPNTGFIPKRYVFDPTEPLTGTDVSLFFVVGMLLLIIVLLSGYMYTNGRLFID
jgi:hypothetical protein